MYTEQDRSQIKKRIAKYFVISGIIMAAMLALYIVGLIQRWEAVVMVDGTLMFVVACFAWLMFIWPCLRYNFFLNDMAKGLGREVAGSIVEVSEQEDYQDGVRVLPVRILLDVEEDERIVYLNATKAEGFPKAGEKVRLKCYGRHIKEVSVVK